MSRIEAPNAQHGGRLTQLTTKLNHSRATTHLANRVRRQVQRKHRVVVRESSHNGGGPGVLQSVATEVQPVQPEPVVPQRPRPRQARDRSRVHWPAVLHERVAAADSVHRVSKVTHAARTMPTTAGPTTGASAATARGATTTVRPRHPTAAAAHDTAGSASCGVGEPAVASCGLKAKLKALCGVCACVRVLSVAQSQHTCSRAPPTHL